jgi:hypothetical protein
LRIEPLAAAVLCVTGLLCAGTGAGEESHAGAESPAEILTAEPVEDDYARTEECLVSSRIDRVRILSDRHIVFQTGREEWWLAQLQAPCPWMRASSKLAFEQKGSRLCAFDIARVVDEQRPGMTVGPACFLPRFESVTPDQVDALRQALKDAKRGKATAESR